MSKIAVCQSCGQEREIAAQHLCWKCYAYHRRRANDLGYGYGVMWDEAENPDATTVYLLLSRNEDLLYVGITRRSTKRIHEHAADKPWFREVYYARFEHYDTRSEAEAREALLVRELRPTYNIALQAPRPAPPPSKHALPTTPSPARPCSTSGCPPTRN